MTIKIEIKPHVCTELSWWDMFDHGEIEEMSPEDVIGKIQAAVEKAQADGYENVRLRYACKYDTEWLEVVADPRLSRKQLRKHKKQFRKQEG